jgi:hypothetical protein
MNDVQNSVLVALIQGSLVDKPKQPGRWIFNACVGTTLSTEQNEGPSGMAVLLPVGPCRGGC